MKFHIYKKILSFLNSYKVKEVQILHAHMDLKDFTKARTQCQSISIINYLMINTFQVILPHFSGKILLKLKIYQ